MHMLQIFINLPQAKQGNAHFALSLAPKRLVCPELSGH